MSQQKSEALFQRAVTLMPGGNSRSTLYYPPHPVYIASGRGAYVTDVDGVERIDFINCYSSGIHGHCHPEIIDAVRAQLETMIAVAAPTEIELELAEILIARIPSWELMRFCNSGTEAVMQCIKAARAFTDRPKIAKVEGTYHGTYDAAEVSQNAEPDKWGDLSAPASVATAHGTPKGVLGDVVVLPLNDIENSIAILDRHADDLAAVMLDAIPARMGFIKMDEAYAKAIRQWTLKRQVLLIFDEVMTLRGGFNGMQGELGILPDLTATGKIIGGGMPIGAFGGRADVMEVFDATKPEGARISHGGTFNAHPLSMAAGIASMKLLDRSAMDELSRLGDRARSGLEDAMQIAGIPGQATGYGSLIGYLFTGDPVRNYREMVEHNSAEPATHLFHHWLDNGVMAMPRSGMLLSTAMTDVEIDRMLEEALVALRTFSSTAPSLMENA